MKKTVPFKKNIFLKNNVAEIVSISLEHTLHQEDDYFITGEFIISGDYKITDASINTESFEFKIPFDISIDEKYNLEHLVIDIDDFYYEVINNDTLVVSIEVMLDKLEEKERCIDVEELKESKEIIENVFPEYIEDKQELFEEKLMEENILGKVDYIEEKIEKAKEKIEEVKDKIKGFVTYRVYILKEDDNVDKIIEKYNTERDILEQYNNLQDLRIGDKIIIPSNE